MAERPSAILTVADVILTRVAPRSPSVSRAGRAPRWSGATQASEGPARRPAPSGPVVIVDPDPAHGQLLAAVLAAAGLTAIVVETVEEAERVGTGTSATILRQPERRQPSLVRDLDPTAERRRDAIAAIIEHTEYRTVFQPMVALYKSEVVGYEALTRFDDGTPPDHRFAEAGALGLGTELELATIASAVAAARDLPEERFLSINLSPELLISHQEALESAISSLQQDRPVVLELTEHDVIHDYEALRSSLARFSPSVQLSVDDAGAGFSTLRHVVMLEPDYVKLDRSWVTNIHIDPTRQALVAGLSHFARVTGCELVAEGIESEPERETLAELDVSLGQGFLLGIPAGA
jgi:EAL domain-containing protein (putative c-di-GMP-specific phosphodiesterase class I)